MKLNLKIGIMAAMIMLLFSSFVYPQHGITKNAEEYIGAGYKTVTCEGFVDSTGALTFSQFDIAGYSPVMNLYKLTTPQGTGTAKITYKRQIYVFGSWRDDKTLYTADSLTTFIPTKDTTSAITNRLVVTGVTTNPDSVKVQIKYELYPR